MIRVKRDQLTHEDIKTKIQLSASGQFFEGRCTCFVIKITDLPILSTFMVHGSQFIDRYNY